MSSALDATAAATTSTPATRLAQFDPRALSGLLRERWKYTRMPAFAESLAQTAPANALTAPQGLKTTAVAAAEQIPGADLGNTERWLPYPLADAILTTTDSWRATVPAGTQMQGMLQLADGRGCGFVQIESSASATLALTLSGQQASFGALQFEVGANASLTLDTTALTTAGIGWLLSRFTLQANARLTLRQYFTGSGSHRHETHVIMAGPGAEAALTGAAVGAAGSRLDQQVILEHTAPHANSHQRYHCVGLAGSKSNFNGRIHIHPGAHATVAELSNRNLALAADAELNTKPELEIYNDDVRCAHGATVGQLDADALYYCQSRGIDAQRAKVLLTAGFLQQCVDGSEADVVADAIRERIA